MNLSLQQKWNVCTAAIQAIGCIQGEAHVHAIVELLMPFLHCSDPRFRVIALEAISQQAKKLDVPQAAMAWWCCLPLACDDSIDVRNAFYNSPLVHDKPRSIEHYC